MGLKGTLFFVVVFFGGLGYVIKLLPAYWLNHADFNLADKHFFIFYITF